MKMGKLTNSIGMFLMIFVLAGCVKTNKTSNPLKPNVILIITDDQGFGDLGYYGNPHIKTPVLDNFSKESVRFDEFLVSPVCAPTRSALMTGRYPLRTGVRDTYRGGAKMANSEVTIAELLKDAGYTTGMIGKWHLGDNYPFRPEDQGFDYALRHLSGGIGQPGDWPNTLKGDSSYFNPILWENGKMVQSSGYCSDVFGHAALNFIEKHKEDRFFLYLSFNAPHTPLQLPQEYDDMYKDIDASKGFEDDPGSFPEMPDIAKERAGKVYGMVSNIDDNLGRLFNKLDQLNLKENTLVIFMTDNGPEHPRYIAGMRGRKSSVFQGGVRVPCFWRYPSQFEGDRDIQTPSAHYDILPTLAEICGGKLPEDRKIDGQSLLPLLINEKAELPERYMNHSWVRHSPVKYKNISTRNNNYKLVGNGKTPDGEDKFELFEIQNDPYELTDIREQKPEVFQQLKFEMDKWFDEMTTSENYLKTSKAIIGTQFENPSMLNLNDATFVKEEGISYQHPSWEVDIKSEGNYEVTIHFTRDIKSEFELELQIGKMKKLVNFQNTIHKMIKISNIKLEEGEATIFPVIRTNSAAKQSYKRPFYVERKKQS